ncbi:hypothetical protein O0I49_02145 [Staphylococcus pseudintermedius]|nr:hypothetical protein [Staphylococcus pseudintermedius]EHC9984761.1 hypothetical protein [Staphylococcus pseudintermedius]EIQ0621547.1 hypothetical protein [Staphylococcus pseudintermedius]EKS1584918.1 hypothetical protein [Staphylococcus pseudintermedius]MDF0018067.1 hypothetical protein [Staphylococcus pseudintermedius]MDF0061673.1 hypothetical protein [Staphylococcus pseudintermedius]
MEIKDLKIGDEVQVSFGAQREENITTKILYLINDDGTLTLIWKDGELVG